MTAETTTQPDAAETTWDATVRAPLLARIKYGVVRTFLMGWARCFSLKGLYLLGRAFGTLEWMINYKRRRRFRERLTQVFGVQADKREISRACRKHFTRIRCDKLFYLIFDKLPKHKILKRVKFHNREMFDAMVRDRGAYVCLSHVGSHHVLILLMTLLGYRVAGVRDPNEGALRRFIQRKFEETFPEVRAARMLYADTFPRDIYRTFQEGYILGSALDVGRQRAAHLRRATVTMFGQERQFLTGTMQIALRCKVPILQGFVVSRKNFYFHLIPHVIAEPEEITTEADMLPECMQRYADNIAEHIRNYPCHISKS